MGLSCSVSNKYLQRYGSEEIHAAIGSMQGFRTEMEDQHHIALSVKDRSGRSCFAVFDGHCGGEASIHASEHLMERLLKLEHLTDEAIREVCLTLDVQMRNVVGRSGTTAVFVIAEPLKDHPGAHELTIGNIGDSRSLVCKLSKGGGFVALTEDHKPDLPKESQRIVDAGGFVARGRVKGELALSRALGDFQYKLSTLPAEKMMVSPVPDITHHTVYPGDVMLLACDGIFEHATWECVHDFVERLSDHKHPDYIQDPADVLSLLFDKALEEGSRDNMTAILVHFKEGKDYHEEGIVELRPGPLAKADSHFLNAYRKDLMAHGVTEQVAKELIEQLRSGVPHTDLVQRLVTG